MNSFKEPCLPLAAAEDPQQPGIHTLEGHPNKIKNVSIIGGGLGGPALALCLKKQHGISCTVYERNEAEDNRGVNIALAPNAVRVLQHIGVLHELRDLGYNYEQLAVSNAHGQQLGLVYNGSAKEYNFKALRIHRSEVHKALLRECKAQGVKVRFGMRLTKLEEGDDEVKLEFANGQVEYAEFVVGADGVYSSVRPFVVDCELTYSGFMGIIGMRIVKERLHESINGVHFPNFFFGKTGFVAMMPSDYHGKELDFFSTMPYRSHKRQEWEDLNKNKGELHRIINERFGSRWPEFIGQICREYNPKDLSQHPFFEVPRLPRWSSTKGRIIMIGDGAHAVTPQAGQGAAMALEDAETLAYTMSMERFPTDYRKYLTVWEGHRIERVERIKAFTNRNGRLRSPDPYFVQMAKEWVMWAVMKFSGPRLGLGWLYEYSGEDIVSVLEGKQPRRF